MYRKRKNLINPLLSGGLLLLTVSVAIWSVVGPLPGATNKFYDAASLGGVVATSSQTGDFNSATQDMQSMDSNAGDAKQPSLAASSRGPHWNRVLRRDSQPTPSMPNQAAAGDVSAAKTVKASVFGTDIQLVGTILEAGKSFAMISDAQGRVDLQPVGGILQLNPPGIRVESVSSDSAVVSHDGKLQTLLISKVAPSEGELGSDVSATESVLETTRGLSLEEELDWANGTPVRQTERAGDQQNGGS